MSGVLSAFTGPVLFVDLDNYGADPTGVKLSDTAFTKAYAVAAAKVQASSGIYAGAMLTLGPGIYQFSPNTVQILDPRIGFTGQGIGITTIYSAGSSGDVVWATDNNWATYSTLGAAPIGNFTISGHACTGAMNGLHYGDRAGARNLPVRCEYFQFSAASQAFWFRNDNGGLSERATGWSLEAYNCATNFVFDGNNQTPNSTSTSFDYCSFDLTMVTGTSLAMTVTGISLVNNADVVGCHIRLRGNIGAANAQTATLISIGTGGSDSTKLAASDLDIAVEADGAGTVNDIVINTAATYGLFACTGQLWFITGTGAYTAGSVTGGLLRFGGIIQSPLMTSAHGSLYQIGPNLASFDSSFGKATLGTALVVDGQLGQLALGAGDGTPTVTPQTAAGSGASASITGTDLAGTISLTTGSGPTSGTQVTVTFANAGPNNALVWLAPQTANLTGGSPGFFTPAGGASSFSVNAAGAPAAATTYTFRYFVIFL